MTQTSTDITIPLPPETVAVIGSLLLLLIASYLVFRAMPSDAAKPKSWRQRFEDSWGLRIKDPLAAALLVVVLFGYAMIFLFALLISLRLIVQLLFGLDLGLPAAADPNASENPASPGLPFGLAALLAAILGAPFIIWRSQVAAKQAAIAEEALFNDKINAAATDLAARRQVTRPISIGGSYSHHHDIWEDDLVRRSAAIDRLEALAKEALARVDIPSAQNIVRILSIYVQELSREYPARKAKFCGSFSGWQVWGNTLRAAVRPDAERAVQALGRVNPQDEKTRRAFDTSNIDLSRCNLQGFDLSGGNYQGAIFVGAYMQGSVLSKAQLQSANLANANLQGAVLTEVDASGVILSSAHLDGSDFRYAVLTDADLSFSEIEYADLDFTNLRGSSLEAVQLYHSSVCQARLTDCHLDGARLWGTALQWSDISDASLRSVDLWQAKLQGSNLNRAQMQGSRLAEVQLSKDTKLEEADLSGAAVKGVSDHTLEKLRPFWSKVFADIHTAPGDPERPEHWQDDTQTNVANSIFSSERQFVRAWGDWASNAHPTVLIAPDYRHN